MAGSLFSVDQVRDLYVLTSFKGVVDPTDDTSQPLASDPVGTTGITFLNDGSFRVLYRGVDGLQASDLVPVSEYINQPNLLWISATSYVDMRRPLLSYTITLDGAINGGEPVAGQEYALWITLYNWGGLSRENSYVKFGAVYATADMDASDFYEALYNSLIRNFQREPEQVFNFALVGAPGSYTGVTITEAISQDYVPGYYQEEPLDITLRTDTILVNGDELHWGVITDNTDVTVAYEENGRNIANLEWFTLGERGDVYREVGAPYIIRSTYLTNPDTQYDVVDIKFYYSGTNHAVQKSNKVLTIVADTAQRAQLNALLAAIATATGLTIDPIA